MGGREPAFIERNPKDFDHPDLTMFLNSALEKAREHRTREAVEFRAKQLHQKPEIAKINILATRENEVLVAVYGQVIRTGIFQEKVFNEAFNFKSRGHEQKSDAVRCVQFGLWRGARRAHPRSGLTTFREAKVSGWATNLWRAWEAKPTSNKATGQIGRNPEGGRAFRLRPRCLLLTDRWRVCSSRAPRLNRKSLAANGIGFLFMTTKSPFHAQSQHGRQRSFPHRCRRLQI
ncbi:MAG: hypothetical protein IH623_08420 [Verrucomicrobia bacterium]|nr:hypothetical protein [Verrucomicrobiota bacterium]